MTHVSKASKISQVLKRVALVLPVLLSFPAQARGGDFPFSCRASEVDMREFVVWENPDSPSGYTATLRTPAGRIEELDVEEIDDGDTYHFEGFKRQALLFDLHFIALIPRHCGEGCAAQADSKTMPVGMDFRFMTVPTSARCAASTALQE